MRKVLRTARPSVSPQEIRRLQAMCETRRRTVDMLTRRDRYDAFDQDRGGGMPVPPESTTVGTRVSLQ